MLCEAVGYQGQMVGSRKKGREKQCWGWHRVLYDRDPGSMDQLRT